MKWLIKREMWEHKGMLFWAPVCVATIMSLLFAAMLVLGSSSNDMHIAYHAEDGNVLNTALSAATIAANKAAIGAAMAATYMAGATPLFLMLGVLVFFYSLSALYEERRDRSLLFWKSLPVSDGGTVLSKAALALLVTPLITIAVATLASLLMLLMACLAMSVKGTHMYGVLLGSAEFYLTPLRILGLLPVYCLWALPSVGWLLMVSAWARSKAFLWAVGAPLLTSVMVIWVNKMFGASLDTSWLMHNIVGRLLLGTVPGSWFMLGHDNAAALLDASGTHASSAGIFTQSWLTLAGPGVWLGAAAGAAMIYVAIRLRRWREE